MEIASQELTYCGTIERAGKARDIFGAAFSEELSTERSFQ